MRLLVFGAGGHAKVVIDAAVETGWEIAGIVGREGDPATVLGHPVTISADGMTAHAFVVAIGDNRTRARYFAEQVATGRKPATIIHPTATIAGSARIGAGTFVAAGAIVNPDARIGENAIINTGCVIEHDVKVGDHALVGPASSLCGAAALGEGVLLGAGATVAPGCEVGAWSVCGAGAAVVSDLPADSLCVGVPARVVRTTGGA